MVECRMWYEVVEKASPNEDDSTVSQVKKEKHMTLVTVVRKE